jgi:membrane protein DedA with SNARE-associated domain
VALPVTDLPVPVPATRARPWRGRPRGGDLAVVGSLAGSGAYGLAMLPVAPSLIGPHPVLLALLTGSLPAMVAAGAAAGVGKIPFVLALLASVPGCMMFDPLYWWAGRRWGPAAVHIAARRTPRVVRFTRLAERLAARYGRLAVVLAYFLPLPSVLVYAAAGWTGMSFVTFLVCDVLGATLWAALCVGLGYGLGDRAVHIADAITRDALPVTGGLIALVVVVVLVRVHRARRPATLTTPLDG